MPPKKPGTLLPIEKDIIKALRRKSLHGNELAQSLRTYARSTVYRALSRLEQEGYVSGAWQMQMGDATPRRMYTLTSVGEAVEG